MRKAASPYEEGAAALERALGLFAAILRDDGHRPLSAQATDLALPISTAHRFAAVLARHGLIVRVARGHYAASHSLARSGGIAREQAILARVARKPMRELARRLKANVHLGVLEGDMVTYLVKAAAGPPLFTREGMQLEAYCSGVGKVLLAHLPAAALDTYLANGPFVPLTAATIIDPAAIRAHLDTVRDQDYASDDREIDDRLSCIAVPVRAADGTVVASLSGSASPPRPVDAERLAALRDCARAIEMRLG